MARTISNVTAQRALELAESAYNALGAIPSRVLLSLEASTRNSINVSMSELRLLTDQLRTVRDWSELAPAGGRRACANQSSARTCFAYEPVSDEDARALINAHGTPKQRAAIRDIPRSSR